MSTIKALMTGSSAIVHAVADKPGGTGGVSKADKAMLKIIRETFEAETGHDCRVTDDGILAIVNQVTKDKFMEMDGDEQIKLLTQAEDAFKGIAVSDPGISGLVAKLDAPFYAEMDACVEAIIKGKQSSVDMLGQFKRVWSAEQFNACPYPGSDKDDVKGTNYIPDIVEKKAADGSKIRVVWLNDIVQAMPKGKAAQQDMDDAAAELKTAGSVARFKGKAMSKMALRDMFNDAKQVRDGMRKNVRIAVQLHHKLSAIDGMPLVKWSWIPGSNDKCPVVPKSYQGKDFVKVTRGPKPLWLVALDAEGNEVPNSGRDFSVGQIVAFNPAKALQAETKGTLGDLIDSAKGEEETAEQIGEKMSVEVFDTTLVVFNAKLSNTAERASLRQRMLEPNNEDFRASVCALYLNLKGAYDANAKWYEQHIHGKEEPEGQRKAG